MGWIVLGLTVLSNCSENEIISFMIDEASGGACEM